MITFKTLKWRNFLSYGNTWSEIDFTKHKTTMISGKNGSGKSTIGEALTFVLFGKPYRNINKPNLVNSINERDCEVEIVFEINKKNYRVVRGIKPNIFEIYCDGDLIDQSSKNKDYQKYLEQNILKLNYKTFTQLVFLGTSSYVPFMQLTAADRREVIEELLDIRVFSRMNTVVKEKLSGIKQAITDINVQIKYDGEKIDIQKDHLKNLKNRTLQSIDFCKQEISSDKSKIEILQSEIQKENEEIQSILEKAKIRDSFNAKLIAINQGKEKASIQINKTQKIIEFYENNNTCPTCSQNIQENFKNDIVKEKQEKIDSLLKLVSDADTKVVVLKNQIDEFSNITNELSSKNIIVQQKQIQIQSIQNYIKKLELDIEKMSGEDVEISKEEEKLVSLEKELKNKISEREQLIEDREYHEIAMLLLKDTGIKTKIIKQYLPIMNKTINKYLSAMDFFVNFNLDENFGEIIKSRHRDTFEYNSFSEGEKFRIDMSLLLTWREICRIKNSTNTNILILDEVFDSSLDNAGAEEFIKLLKILSEKINIFVITHRPDILGDKFDHNIQVDKKNNFSNMR